MKMTASSKPAALAITPEPHEVERTMNANDDDAVNNNNNNNSSARGCTPNGITVTDAMGETVNDNKTLDDTRVVEMNTPDDRNILDDIGNNDDGFSAFNEHTIPLKKTEQQYYKYVKKVTLPIDNDVGMMEECTIEDTGTSAVDSCTIGDNVVDDTTVVETTTTGLKSKLDPNVNNNCTATTKKTVAPGTCGNVNVAIQTNKEVARNNKYIINLLDDEKVVEEDVKVSSWEDVKGVSESKQNPVSNDDIAMGNVVVIDLLENYNGEGKQLQGLVTVENNIDQNNRDKNENESSSEKEGSPRENITIDILDEIDRDGDEEQVRDIIDNGDEVQFIGSNGKNALSDYPHSREDCVTHLCIKDPVLFCPQCYCFVCDVKATKCMKWDHHCRAVRSDIRWCQRRSSVRSKRKKPERMAKELSGWNNTNNLVVGKRKRRTTPS